MKIFDVIYKIIDKQLYESIEEIVEKTNNLYALGELTTEEYNVLHAMAYPPIVEDVNGEVVE